MEHVETVIVGAGQAGLATAQRLRSRGRECLVLDHNQRIGDGWRQQWAALLSGEVRRTAGHEIPRGPVVFPDQGRRGLLP
jgi:putative flavoprotein involved in K+ transport